MNVRWRRFAKLVGVGIPALLVAGVALGAPKKTDGPTLTRSSTAMSSATIFCFYREAKAGLNRGPR